MIRFQMVQFSLGYSFGYSYCPNLSKTQTKRLLVYKKQSHTTRPFANQPVFDYLKSRLVWISDPHCMLKSQSLHNLRLVKSIFCLELVMTRRIFKNFFLKVVLFRFQVTGNVKSGFLAEFLPEEVGPHIISVEYNNIPVGGTPFTGAFTLPTLTGNIALSWHYFFVVYLCFFIT